MCQGSAPQLTECQHAAFSLSADCHELSGGEGRSDFCLSLVARIEFLHLSDILLTSV